VIPAILSNCLTFWLVSCSRSFLRFSLSSISLSSFFLLLSSSCLSLFTDSNRWLKLCSFCLIEFSFCLKVLFFWLTSFSCSLFSFRYFSLASSIRFLEICSAFCSASATISWAFFRASSSCFLKSLTSKNRPTTTPIINAAKLLATSMTINVVLISILHYISILLSIVLYTHFHKKTAANNGHHVLKTS